jgi:hypothetical protein
MDSGSGGWTRLHSGIVKPPGKRGWMRLTSFTAASPACPVSTLRGFNDLGLHGRRSRPLYALTIRLTDEADQLEAERPGWSWPGYAYVLGWLNLVARQRIEDVDIVAVALGHFDHQPR